VVVEAIAVAVAAPLAEQRTADDAQPRRIDNEDATPGRQDCSGDGNAGSSK
jgi:hypothetical protein